MASTPPPPQRPSTPDALTGFPKDSPRGPPTPPPAYFPRQNQTQNQNHNVAVAMMNAQHQVVNNNAALAARFAGTHHPVPLPVPRRPAQAPVVDARALGFQVTLADYMNAAPDSDEEEGEEDDDDDNGAGTRAAITVRISTAVRVSGDRNVVCFAASPAETARAVAEAVTCSLREEGDGGPGVPMIDEEGRPRPLRIEIEAGVEVHGEGNVLGGEEVVMRALGNKRRRRQDDEGEEVRRPRRRARSSSV